MDGLWSISVLKPNECERNDEVEGRLTSNWIHLDRIEGFGETEMDLKKHFVGQPGGEQLSGISMQARPAGAEGLRPAHLIEGSETEPRIYSVRKLLQNLPPDLVPGQHPAVDPPATAGWEAPSNPASGPEPASGLKGAVLSFVEGSPREYQIFQAVAKLFEQTRDARERLTQLVALYEPIEALGQTVAGAFVPLDTFRQQLAQLARSFGPIKAFSQEMALIAQTCDAIKPLQEQMAQLSGGFQLHLATLIKALEPAEEIRMRVLQLAEAFEPMATLRERLSELHDAFDGATAEAETALENGTVPEGEQAPRPGPTGSAVTFYVAKSA